MSKQIKCPACKKVLENWDVCIEVEAFGYVNRGGETEVKEYGNIKHFYCANCGRELPEKVVNEYLYTK